MSDYLLQGQPYQYLAAEMDDFKALLNKIAQRYPSRNEFAEAIGINPSRLSRALNTGDFPFNVANCLRLAKLSGESPGEILRAAGKADVADLIESLYGKDRTKLLSAGERDLLEQFEQLTPRARESLRSLLSDLTPKRTKQKRAS